MSEAFLHRSVMVATWGSTEVDGQPSCSVTFLGATHTTSCWSTWIPKRSKSWDGMLLRECATSDFDTKGYCCDGSSLDSLPTTARSIVGSSSSSDSTIDSDSTKFDFVEVPFQDGIETGLSITMQTESMPPCLPRMCFLQSSPCFGQWLNTSSQILSCSNALTCVAKSAPVFTAVGQPLVLQGTSASHSEHVAMKPSILGNLVDAVAMAKQLKSEATQLRAIARKKTGNQVFNIRTSTVDKHIPTDRVTVL